MERHETRCMGDTLREAQLTAIIYEGLCGLDMAVTAREEDAQ